MNLKASERDGAGTGPDNRPGEGGDKIDHTTGGDRHCGKSLAGIRRKPDDEIMAARSCTSQRRRKRKRPTRIRPKDPSSLLPTPTIKTFRYSV